MRRPTMDMAEQPTTPAFTRLPTELLDMILDQVTPYRDKYAAPHPSCLLLRKARTCFLTSAGANIPS
jgi:hypothetical protein